MACIWEITWSVGPGSKRQFDYGSSTLRQSGVET